MNYSRFAVVTLLLVAWASAQADTIYLKNGVRFDGVVTPVPDQEGIYRVSAGERKLIYRESEIDRIEKNNKTGHLDKEELLNRWAERNKKLTEETGLNADQRRLVRGLMMQLKSDDDSVRIAVRDKLVSLQEEFDVYGYIASLYTELSPLLAPNVLRVLAQIDPVRSVPLLQETAQSNYFEKRAVALELLGRMRHKDSIPIVARGLADFNQQVQISAIYALAGLEVREATPALVSLLSNADLRVSGAAREALNALWASQLGDEKPKSVSEWEAFWNPRSGGAAPIQIAQLTPLSPEEEEMKRTYDSNH